MKRNRKSSKPRLSQDGENLISLALGLAGSQSRREDRYWETALASCLTTLADARRDSVIDSALDHLYQTHDAGFTKLIEEGESVAESLTLEHDGAAWDVLLISIPFIVASKFALPTGAVTPDVLAMVNALLLSDVVATNARLATAPYLYSLEHLPQKFSALRDVTRTLGLAALNAATPELSLKAKDEVPQLVADTRFLIGAIATPAGAAHFQWQEWASRSHRGRSHTLDRWVATSTEAFAPLLPGCQFQALLPDAYFCNAREADRHIRPVSLQSAIGFLTTTLKVAESELRAIVAGFGEEIVDEMRIGFTAGKSAEIVHGEVWPLLLDEDEHDALLEIEACLRASGVTQIDALPERYPPDSCADCGAPLFADGNGEVVHPELPEQVEVQPTTLH
ncbi:MAG: DUF2863 family protein [Burkholderiales bacterium]